MRLDHAAIVGKREYLTRVKSKGFWIATAVLPLGDEQYETGTLDGFSGSYDPTWGQFKAITKPVPGNHEYQTPGATGYYSYYGAAAGDPTKGYYSYDLGSWHMIALNGNCGAIGGCGPAPVLTE